MSQKIFEKQLNEVNDRLKVAKMGVTLIQKGNSLYARGTFPAKPGAKKTEPHQQEIALKVKAVPAGLREAEAKAKEISSALVLKKFDWMNYSSRLLTPRDQRTVAEWCMALEQDYFERRKRTAESEDTWSSHYREYLRRLPQTAVLTFELLEQAVRRTEPDSCTRHAMCLACGLLGKFAGFDVQPLKALKGRYSSMKPTPRDLPTDEVIAQGICQIRNPKWRWVAGMGATYGLRPHEIFHLDTQELEAGGNMITVLRGKTGARKVPPLYPEWIEQFNLRHKQLPQVTGKNNRALGSRVSAAFRRYKLPFRPYDLRHCWAVRSLRFGAEVSLAARRMGHSVDMHTRTYQAWISEGIDRQAYEATINNPNRPQAPIMQVDSEAGAVREQSDPSVATSQISNSDEPTVEQIASEIDQSATVTELETAATLEQVEQVEQVEQMPRSANQPSDPLIEGEGDSLADDWRDCA